MKILFLFLLMPLLSIGQTVHVKDEKIVYEGKEKTAFSVAEVMNRAQQALPKIIGNYRIEEQSENSVKARGELKLRTPHHLIRTVAYSIKLNATDGGYEYLIDSVFFTEQERGKKEISLSSKEVLKNVGETGKIVGETEKILNETDMRFQKILALLRNQMKES